MTERCVIRRGSIQRRSKAPSLAVLLCTVGLLAGCATEEDINVGDPARVSGGFLDQDDSGGCEDCGNSCMVNTACSVSWADDVFPILSNPQIGGCGNAGGSVSCHAPGSGSGDLTFDNNNAQTSLANLLAYSLLGAGDYVYPCDPSRSAIVCNLDLQDGVENSFVGEGKTFTGPCNSLMPKTMVGGSTARTFNQSELDTITTWITCGAPESTAE